MSVPLWIKALIVAAGLAAIAWKVDNYLDSVEQRGYDRAVVEFQAKMIEAQNAAVAEHNRAQAVVATAIKERTEREKTIRGMAATNAVIVGGLRDDLDALRAGMSATAVDALRNTAATLSVVFGECAERYSGLAEKADRHASDAQAVTDAWPTGKVD